MKLEIRYLNAARFTKLFIAASRWVLKHSDVLNDLNVYPVPNGNTGSNISMTLQNIENELIKVDQELNMFKLSTIIIRAVNQRPKGSSGKLLALFITGFFQSIRDKEEVSVDDVIIAFEKARDSACKGDITPIYGGMLTVISRVVKEAKEYKGDKNDFVLFLVYLKDVAKEVVEETGEMVPEVKEAGVVDAGGKGFFYILEGFERSVTDPEMLKDLERVVQSQKRRRRILENIKEKKEIFKKKMNKKIAVVTDSTSDLPDEFLNKENLKIVHLTVSFSNDEEYKDGIELSKKAFWNKINKEKLIAKATHPSPREVKKVYEELLQNGYTDIISIHLSSKLSGTLHSAKIAKELLKERGEGITLFDSKCISYGLGNQVIRTLELVEKNLEKEEIIKQLEDEQKGIRMYFVLNDRRYLGKSGKINKLRAYLGYLLNLKTIFKLNDGEVEIAYKCLGNTLVEKAIVAYVKKLASREQISVELAWGGREKEEKVVRRLMDKIRYTSGKEVERVYEVGGTVGASIGAIYGVLVKKSR